MMVNLHKCSNLQAYVYSMIHENIIIELKLIYAGNSI